jgi:integrase
MNSQSRGAGYSALFDDLGRRKYLTGSERAKFLAATAKLDKASAALAQLLFFTGCRVSEALAVTPNRLDAETARVAFRTLKRRRLVFRAVPIPRQLVIALTELAAHKGPEDRIWSWCRVTAWRRVKAVMESSGVTGTQACPRGLRHAFGVANAEMNIPASLTQRWMGHARLETTAIYQEALADEERAFAKRLWARP